MTREPHDHPGESTGGEQPSLDEFRASLGFASERDLCDAVTPWEERSEPGRSGQIRLGQPVEGESGPERDLCLVVGESWEDFGRRWWTVFALDAETAARGVADALIDATENDLALPLRLRTDHAAPVPEDELGGVIGGVGDPLMREIESGTLAADRFGPELLDEDDWRLQVDPMAWKRWFRRRATYEASLAEFEQQERRLNVVFLDRYRKARPALRRELPGVLGHLSSPTEASPAPTQLRAIADRLERMPVDLDAAAAGLPVDMQDVLGPPGAFWPLTLRKVPGIEVRLDRSDEGATVVVTGLPPETEGLDVVLCLPYAPPCGVQAGWVGGAPGLVRVDGPVQAGVARASVTEVPGDGAEALRDLAVLPPLDDGGEAGSEC